MKTLVRPNHETVSADPAPSEAPTFGIAKHARLMGALTVELIRHAPLAESEYRSLKNEHRERLGLPPHPHDQPVEAGQHINRPAA